MKKNTYATGKGIAIVSIINDDDKKIIDSQNNDYSAEQIETSTE